jgi:hypothetical protein
MEPFPYCFKGLAVGKLCAVLDADAAQTWAVDFFL